MYVLYQGIEPWISQTGLFIFGVKILLLFSFTAGQTLTKQMTVSYKRIWKLLIDRDMKKKDLQAAAEGGKQIHG